MKPSTRTNLKAGAAGPDRRRTRGKGRRVEREAQAAVRAAISNLPKRKDLLVEYLHCLQDRYGHLSAAQLVALADELRLAPAEIFEVATFYHHFDVVVEGEKPPPPITLRVCDSITCEMLGAEALIASLESSVTDDVRVQRVPCVGRCEQAPVAVVGQRPVPRAELTEISKLIRKADTDFGPAEAWIRLSAYRREDGYEVFRRCRDGSIDHETILNALETSGLRGLGGAGFPAGKKWRILKEQPAPRLMAINIDEGEPGTFKDRYYLERDPHRFLEGMLIAAQVIGIESCYLYVRDEYPGVLEVLRQSIIELQNEFGVELPNMELRRGAGAYICGEESAMIESIEGKRGMPRLRPPYVAEVGLFGRPTLEHNCETLYWVRDIIERGPDWFAGQGRRGRKGVRSFSVSGRVNKPGVHLAPAGISLRELIDEYCGGMPEGHHLSAYFPGGASGGILPASLADEPLDFDTLHEHGCFIGSAAVIVLSNQDSVPKAARNAMRFFAHESCGQCTPCRVGSDRAARLMENEKWDPDVLEDLCVVMEDASICGLGQAAPNPLRCVMKYFPEEVGIK
ncbi:MAG TPA: NADH-quinone oxidoreductase subunit F [Gammaproteobacteria bacterium]|jgi:formate dehydrogenase|nr:NADH-quinone oxidoreductase subunit F [Gammaproteobacteria bacterium]